MRSTDFRLALAAAIGLTASIGLASCEKAAVEAPKTVAEAAPAPVAEAAPAPKSPLKEVESPGAAKSFEAAYRSDTIDVPLAAKGDAQKGDKIEYMVRMKAGDPLVYSWEAKDAKGFWHEFHGHTPEAVTFYKKAEGAKHQGSLTAPFDGVHGWYFENRTDQPVAVRVRLSGFYELVPVEEG